MPASVQYNLGPSTEQGERKATAVECMACNITSLPTAIWHSLLCIVVPAAFGSVAENKVQHKGCIKNVKLAAVPVAVVCKIVLRHLRPQVATLAE
jgi:hypothetical protein